MTKSVVIGVPDLYLPCGTLFYAKLDLAPYYLENLSIGITSEPVYQLNVFLAPTQRYLCSLSTSDKGLVLERSVRSREFGPVVIDSAGINISDVRQLVVETRLPVDPRTLHGALCGLWRQMSRYETLPVALKLMKVGLLHRAEGLFCTCGSDKPLSDDLPHGQEYDPEFKGPRSELFCPSCGKSWYKSRIRNLYKTLPEPSATDPELEQDFDMEDLD